MRMVELIDFSGCFDTQPTTKKIKIKNDKVLILITLYSLKVVYNLLLKSKL